MAQFVEQKIGGFGIIQKQEDGTICQIGLSESQYYLLEIFLSNISKEDSPLIKLPKEFNLKFSNEKIK